MPYRFGQARGRAVILVLSLLVLLPFQNCGPAGSVNENLSSTSTSPIDQSYIPDPATALYLHVASNQQIDLRWQDNSDNEAGFKIERAVAATGPIGGIGTWMTIATTAPNVTTYSNTNLQASTTYYYRVKSFNNAGAANPTMELQATTFNNPTSVPSPPSNLMATATAATVLSLAWNDNSSNESGFKVERSTNGGATFTLIAAMSADATSFQDVNLTPSTSYSYRVRATNTLGDSTNSNVATATTLAATNTSTFTFVNTNVFQTNCVSCHHSGSAAGGINLDTYGAISANATQANSAITGNQMPPGSPLNATQKSWVQSWINAGKPNN